MKGILLFWITVLGAFAQGPVAVPATIYGTVRNLEGEIIDNPYFEQLAIFADGVEIGRAPLEIVPEGGENYRLNLTNVGGLANATLSAKLIRDGQEVPLVDSAAWLAFEPVQGQLTRFDFLEKVDPGDGGGGGPVTPPATIFGTVRNLAGEIIDNPGVERLAIFADGAEIGRVPLELDAEGDENYRFELPNVAVPDLTTYSVKLIRDGAEVPLVESESWLVYEPVRGDETRFDFMEEMVPGGGGPVATPATIFGSVRNLAGETIDNPGAAQLVIFADGSEIGRVPLELDVEGDENYRFELPNVIVPDLTTYSVKLIRNGEEVPLVEPGSWLVFEPVRGEEERFDFVEQAVPGGGGPGEEPVTPQTTIYGLVRNLAGDAIDIPAFEQLAIFADDAEIGRVPLEVNLVGDENYRFNIPGKVDLDAAIFSVKLIRDGQEVSVSGSGAWLVFEPVVGQLMRFDFMEEASGGDEDPLISNPGPKAPYTTVYGTIRNQAGEIIDDPLYEQLVIFANGVEIGRAPLQYNQEASENYRFQIPNFSVASRATHTVKLIRDGQLVFVFDSFYGFRISRPIQGELRRLDFTEMADLNLNGVPDEVEIEGGSLNGDFDFDGLKDFQEAAIGTDPRDPESGLNFKVVGELANGDVEIAYDVVSGHSYTLEVSNDAYDWIEISVYNASSDTRRTVTATPVAGLSVFWRIRVD
ncbi:MAG: hypothetical protein ABF384_19090 [Verrucomicrobiales bacterium]